MDITRCPKCNKRLIAVTDRGRTELKCPKCDEIDPHENPRREMGRQSFGTSDEGGLIK
jgi:phage FluMu protein Com